MNNQSRVRGVLLAALVPLMTWSADSARAQQPGDQGSYYAAPRTMPQGPAHAHLPGSMSDMRPPTRPAGYDYPPQPMNGSPYMMPAGGTPAPGGMPGPMLSPEGSIQTGPMPMQNGVMPQGVMPNGPMQNGPMPNATEPPYSSYPTSGYPSGGCANGSCASGGCASGNCGAGGCATDWDSRGCSPTGIFANLVGYIGFDGARGPEDLGINANVGGRAGVGTVVTLLEDAGIALQVGTAFNRHATATIFQRDNGGPGERTQHFSTVGLFQRACNGLLWGVAYDYVHTSSYATIDASQWRGQVGWKFNECNEFGIWGTHRDRGDTVTFAGDTFHLRAVDQVNFYFTRYWSCAMTRAWIGVAERHGQAVLNSPDRGPTDRALVYGAEFLVPLSSWVALYGDANFITPYDSGVVAAFVGLAVYPGGTANQIPRSRFAPMFSLANNSTFALDARRD